MQIVTVCQKRKSFLPVRMVTSLDIEALFFKAVRILIIQMKLWSPYRQIRKRYPDCAITLSLGERSKESYQKLYDAGADRYLLRHEAADPELYQKLHPESLSLENRIQCLWNLKEIGYAVGTGFMV